MQIKCINIKCIIVTQRDTLGQETRSCETAHRCIRNPKVHVLMVCTSTCRQPVRPFGTFWHGGGAATLTRHKHTHLHVAFPEGGAGSCCKGVDGELRLPPPTQCTKVTRRQPEATSTQGGQQTQRGLIDCYRE